MDYFAPAVRPGLTATPKRLANGDPHACFGKPGLYLPSEAGINDGFVTPFCVRQISTAHDACLYPPDSTAVSGPIEEDRRHREPVLHRIIAISAREQKRAEIFMHLINQRKKTLVVCATQDHALAVRGLLRCERSRHG